MSKNNNMQAYLRYILFFTFFVFTMYGLANENVQIKNDTYFNAEAKTASQDSLISINHSPEKKMYWGLGTAVLAYASYSYFLQTFDGFIGYNINKKIALENQLSYYQGQVKTKGYSWGWEVDAYIATGRYVSNNFIVKAKFFRKTPLFLCIGYKSEFNLYFRRHAHEDWEAWEGGEIIEPVTINKKPKYWNSLYLLCIDYTIAKRKKYTIEVSLPLYISNASLNSIDYIYFSLPVPKKLYFDKHATGRLNHGIGLRIKF